MQSFLPLLRKDPSCTTPFSSPCPIFLIHYSYTFQSNCLYCYLRFPPHSLLNPLPLTPLPARPETDLPAAPATAGFSPHLSGASAAVDTVAHSLPGTDGASLPTFPFTGGSILPPVAPLRCFRALHVGALYVSILALLYSNLASSYGFQHHPCAEVAHVVCLTHSSPLGTDSS